MPYRINPISGTFDYYTGDVKTTPGTIVEFDTEDPNLGGTVFTPDSQQASNTLYVSTDPDTVGQTWIWDVDTLSYETYKVEIPENTPFVLEGTSIDAGGNKTSRIQRTGRVTLDGSEGSYMLRLINRRTSGTGAGAYIFRDAGQTAGYGLRIVKGSINQLRVEDDGSLLINDEYTLPNVKGTAGQVLTDDGAGNVAWSTINSDIPQSSKIYVDSENGVNSTGRGNINEPYLTPEYALSDISNTGTITGDTNSSVTLTNISDIDNALLEVGMYLTGIGIPFGTIIVAKGDEGSDVNTLTLSKSTTATASGLTLTWIKIYELILNGSFVVASSLFKEGIYINSQTAMVSWGAFNLFDLGVTVFKTPYKILGKGDYFGTHIDSKFISASAIQKDGCSIDINFGNIETVGTSYTFSISTGTANENYLTIKGGFVNARFGRVANISGEITDVDFDSYGLLSGIAFNTNNTSHTLKGTHTTPASVNVLTSGYYLTSKANLFGSTIWNGYSSHRGRLSGTTHSVYVSNDIDIIERPTGTLTLISGQSNIKCSVTSGLNMIINSGAIGNFYGSGYILGTVNGTAYNWGTAIASLIGNGKTYNHGRIDVTSSNSFNGTIDNYGTLTTNNLGNNLEFFVNNYGTHTLSQYGLGRGGAWTYKNYGTIESKGAFTNNTAMINLNNAGCIFENYGRVINNETDVTKAVIEKTAGKLLLRQGSYIKQSNGLSPIRCTANTSDSKDVYYFGVTDNCDSTTFGLLFAYDGSAFAPNDLVGGTLYEDTNY